MAAQHWTARETRAEAKGVLTPFHDALQKDPPWNGAHQCTTLRDRDIQSNTAWLWGAGTLCCLPGRMLGGWSSGDSVEEDSLMCHPREMNKASGVLTQDMPLHAQNHGCCVLDTRCELPSPAAATSAFSSVFQLVTVGGQAPAPPVSGIRPTLLLSPASTWPRQIQLPHFSSSCDVHG